MFETLPHHTEHHTTRPNTVGGTISTIQIRSIPLQTKRLTGAPEYLILKWSDIAARPMDAPHDKAPAHQQTLAELRTGQRCILDRLDLPEDMARRLMELGFLPGNEIVLSRKAPGGGPRVYRVDGSEVALRQETASHLYLRRDPESDLIVLP
jgi:ferrous iron transport protein A